MYKKYRGISEPKVLDKQSRIVLPPKFLKEENGKLYTVTPHIQEELLFVWPTEVYENMLDKIAAAEYAQNSFLLTDIWAFEEFSEDRKLDNQNRLSLKGFEDILNDSENEIEKLEVIVKGQGDHFAIMNSSKFSRKNSLLDLSRSINQLKQKNCNHEK